MTFFDLPTDGPGGGLWPGEHIVTDVTMQGGAALKGQVVMFDMSGTLDAATTSATPGDAASIWANVKDPTAASVIGNQKTIFGIALAAAADGALLDVQTYGIVNEALVIGASGSMALGTPLIVQVSATALDIVVATGELIVGMGLETVTTPTSATLGKVFFNGWAPFFGSAAA